MNITITPQEEDYKTISLITNNYSLKGFFIRELRIYVLYRFCFWKEYFEYLKLKVGGYKYI